MAMTCAGCGQKFSSMEEFSKHVAGCGGK